MIYFDETGNSGGNLLDKDQPVFTLNIVSIALILVVCFEMGKSSIIDWKTIAIAIVGFTVTFRFKKLNSAFVVLGGALLGYLLFLI